MFVTFAACISKRHFDITPEQANPIGITDWWKAIVVVLDEVRQRTVLTVGFMNQFNGDQIDSIETGIRNRIFGQQSL